MPPTRERVVVQIPVVLLSLHELLLPTRTQSAGLRLEETDFLGIVLVVC